eukprot:6543370-Lingulodinium_polyedra.AAC.1
MGADAQRRVAGRGDSGAGTSSARGARERSGRQTREEKKSSNLPAETDLLDFFSLGLAPARER